MNKHLKQFVAAALVGLSFCGMTGISVFASPKYVRIIGEPVAVRESAGTSGKFIKKLHSGNQVVYLAKKDDASGVIWYKVELEDGKTGWVTSAYSETIEKSSVGRLEVAANLMNVRAGASLTSKSIATVRIGRQFDYFSSKQDSEGQTWYKIQYDAEQTAWLLGTYCEIIRQASPDDSGKDKKTDKTDTKTTKDSGKKQVEITESPVNVRSAAGTGSQKIGSTSQGKKYTYLAEQKDSNGTTWYKIQYTSDKTGWVISSLSRIVPADAKTDTKTDKKTDKKQIEITTSPVNVRASASLSGKKLGTTSKGKTFTILATKKDSGDKVWYQIQYTSKTKGWVMGKFCSKTDSDTKTDSKSTAKKVEIVESPVNVRNAASMSGKKIGTTSKGKKYTYLASKKDEDGNTWYQIQFTSKTKGWILGRLGKLTAK